MFEQFIREKRYLKGVSPSTEKYLRSCWKAYQRFAETIDKPSLSKFVTGMREAGMSIGTCNAYIRGINSYLGWLYENQHINERLRIKLLKSEQRVLKTFTDEQLRTLLTFKPKTRTERRLRVILWTLADTGCRIGELLTLRRDKCDLDGLYITVLGKGNKERTVPISVELRRELYRYLQSHSFAYVFPNRDGGKLLYDNLRRDYQKLVKKLGIEGVDGSFHAMRRRFAQTYVRNGGNIFHLMVQLGHTDITMSKRYCSVSKEDLADTHMKTSPLTRLR